MLPFQRFYLEHCKITRNQANIDQTLIETVIETVIQTVIQALIQARHHSNLDDQQTR